MTIRTRRTRILVRAAIAVGLAAAACGKPSPTQPASTTTTTSTPPPGVLQVGGQYQITQQGVTDSCNQGTQIPSVTATVTHTPGGGEFTMADSGGTTFRGTVQPDGTFTANAVFGPDSGGQTYTQTLQGRFTTTGFTGLLSVDVQPRACAFTRNWTATKQGPPNVIP